MCAIFGMIGRTDHDLLRKVSKIQIYRGPDSQGFFESDDKKVLLGKIYFFQLEFYLTQI